MLDWRRHGWGRDRSVWVEEQGLLGVLGDDVELKEFVFDGLGRSEAGLGLEQEELLAQVVELPMVLSREVEHVLHTVWDIRMRVRGWLCIK